MKYIFVLLSFNTETDIQYIIRIDTKLYGFSMCSFGNCAIQCRPVICAGLGQWAGELDFQTEYVVSEHFLFNFVKDMSTHSLQCLHLS